MKPVLLNQATRPHAFRHVKDMDNTGVYWRKAWMTNQIAINWFDTCFIPDDLHHCRRRGLPFKVLMLLDNTKSHLWLLIGRHKCWFIGQTIESNGKLYFISPMDVTYLILPYLMKCPWFHSHHVVLRSQLLTLNVTTFDLPTLLAAAGVHPVSALPLPLCSAQLLTLNVATFDLPTLLAAAGVHPSRQHAVIRLTCAFLRKTGQLQGL
ncbi:hypothetical protein GWK47_051261 [Chionoecetes opilio]|uniref:DDE-1 domain-containing protein n=1 Tax=Chionoecetes opilio TaxID=41210 RepID=A0A8J4Y7M1_CHIOP|nr:hypothetical protein GWK47_051261 [Chionoecetes opilio]